MIKTDSSLHDKNTIIIFFSLSHSNENMLSIVIQFLFPEFSLELDDRWDFSLKYRDIVI